MTTAVTTELRFEHDIDEAGRDRIWLRYGDWWAYGVWHKIEHRYYGYDFSVYKVECFDCDGGRYQINPSPERGATWRIRWWLMRSWQSAHVYPSGAHYSAEHAEHNRDHWIDVHHGSGFETTPARWGLGRYIRETRESYPS